MAQADIVSSENLRYTVEVLSKLSVSLFLSVLIFSSAFDQVQTASSHVAISNSRSISVSTDLDASDDVRGHHLRPVPVQTGGVSLTGNPDLVNAPVPAAIPISYDVSESILLQRVLLL